MLEIKSKKTAIVKIFDVEYELKKPSVRQIEEYQAAIKNDEMGSVAILSKFFVDLGLPEEIVKELDIESLTELSVYINGGKKN